MTIYLTMEDILALHEQQIERFGGASGVRDQGLVQAALLRPQTGYYSDVIEEASALWESLTMNHGFVDGNKRIGFAATYVFLRLNDIVIEADANEPARFILENLEAGTMSRSVMEDWLRAHTNTSN